MDKAATPRPRPLSPHLQIYRPNLLMVTSILHRITGAFLYLAALLGVWWLVALATSESHFARVASLFASLPGRMVLIASLYALLHHAFGGLKHLFWDTDHGLDVPIARRLSVAAWLAAVAATAVITAIMWT